MVEGKKLGEITFRAKAVKDADNIIQKMVQDMLLSEVEAQREFLLNTYIGQDFIATPSLSKKGIKPVLYYAVGLTDHFNADTIALEKVTHFKGEEVIKIKVPEAYLELLKGMFYEVAMRLKGEE